MLLNTSTRPQLRLTTKCPTLRAVRGPEIRPRALSDVGTYLKEAVKAVFQVRAAALLSHS
jgi:hypothetical protein